MYVVSGLPRSGTSLVMQMLEAAGVPILSDGARAPDEDNPRGYYELAAVKGIARDASFLADAHGRAVKIVAPLLPSLPDGAYRIVFVERALAEVLDSQRAMMVRRGTTDGADDFALRAAFEAVLERVSAWLDATEGVEVLRMRHEGILQDPEAAAREIAAFVGGEAADRVEAIVAVVDPALHRQRRR